MKYFLLSLLFASTALADTPAQISADYHKQAAAALAKVNDTLEKAATPLVASLVKAGDTEGATELREQLTAKTAGEPVDKPLTGVAVLFKSYDAARARALEPAQKAAVARIDSMLSSSEGKKLDVVTELGQVRAEIEAGKVVQAVAAPTKPDFKSFLKQNKISKSWGYYLNADYTNKNGTLQLNADGTLFLNSSNSCPGTWMPTKDPTVLAFDLKTEQTPSEKTEMIIKGKEATIKRPSGLRYLKPEF